MGTLLSPIMSIPRDANDGFSKLPPSIFPSYRQYAVLGTDPVLVDFIIRKSPDSSPIAVQGSVVISETTSDI